MTLESRQCGSQGALTTILVEDSGTAFSATSKRYDFVAENLGLQEVMVGGNGLPGRLDPSAEHVRRGPGYVAGRIMMNVSPKELDFWLTYISTNDKVLNAFTPSNLDKKVDIMCKRDQATYVYSECYVNRALWRAATNINTAEPQLLELMLEFYGKDEASGTFPATPPAVPNTNVLYWISADSALTLNSVVYPFVSFNLLYDNHLEVLMRNSLRPTCIRSRYRSVRFQPRLPHSDDSAANIQFTEFDAAGSLSLLSSVNLGNPNSETTFSFNRLFGPRKSPRTTGRVETVHDVDFTSWAGSDETTNPVVTITNRFPT